MLTLKLLKKSQAYNIISSCLKRTKDFENSSPLIQASFHENDHPDGPLSVLSSYCRHRFETEGMTEPMDSSIEHIIAHVLGSKKETEYHEKRFDDLQLEKLKMLCNRRLMKMPLEYVSGEEEFKDTPQKLAPAIYIPESQTEILVDLLLKHIARSCSSQCTVLEIGCGVGAISLSLLRLCDSIQVVAIDTNIIACELTLYNAQNLGLENRLTVLHATLEEDGEIKTTANISNNLKIDFQKETFNFIVSNPPCTPVHDIPKYQTEFEDVKAHNGGEDGLKVIKSILLYASNKLNKDGILLLEVLPNQPEKIKILTDTHYPSKLRFDHTYKDYCNNERVLEITRIGL